MSDPAYVPGYKPSIWSSQSQLSAWDTPVRKVASQPIIKHKALPAVPKQWRSFQYAPQLAEVLTRRPATISLSHPKNVNKFLSSPENLRLVDSIISRNVPTQEDYEQRLQTLEIVQRCVQKQIGAKVFLYGSTVMKTYVRSSDINIALFFTHNHSRTWIHRTMNALEAHLLGTSRESTEDIVLCRLFTQESGKLGRVIVGELSSGHRIEISANSSCVLSSNSLIEEVDSIVGKSHLFKRSLLLAKIWSINEAKILHDRRARVSEETPARVSLHTYLLSSILLFIFNAYGDEIKHPLDALYYIIKYTSVFPWERYAVSVFGPVRLRMINGKELTHKDIRALAVKNDEMACGWPLKKEPLFPVEMFHKYVGVSSVTLDHSVSRMSRAFSSPSTFTTTSAKEGFTRKYFNVLDPRDPMNNLGEHYGKEDALALKKVFTRHAKAFEKCIINSEDEKNAATAIQALFPSTLQSQGRLSPIAMSHYAFLKSDIDTLRVQLQEAMEFSVPDLTEDDLCRLITEILTENPHTVTVGKMGSLLHSKVNNHSLPAMLKQRYGGLKKFLNRHQEKFTISNDHPHNPHVYLAAAQTSEPGWNESGTSGHSSYMLCPLTGHLLKVPVVTLEGITYERSSIERWRVEKGNVSPLNGKYLDLSILIPNIALSRLLNDYKSGMMRRECAPEDNVFEQGAGVLKREPNFIVKSKSCHSFYEW